MTVFKKSLVLCMTHMAQEGRGCDLREQESPPLGIATGCKGNPPSARGESRP